MSCQSAPGSTSPVACPGFPAPRLPDTVGPGSVGGPMRCPWYLFHRRF
ncbi:unnamed protein product [Staurois parvus]|uniref:Uncharacterized protein n=1 Tax=Staurois parvus TaxID=386267 RepID=A0ABN9FJE3_9NEOB|nr:unnamed protein product [Staurois parvus]